MVKNRRQLLERIAVLQGVQKKHHPDTLAWHNASVLLNDSFRRMAALECGTCNGEGARDSGNLCPECDA